MFLAGSPLLPFFVFFFFFNDTATTEIYTLSLHDALPISPRRRGMRDASPRAGGGTSAQGLRRVPQRRGPGFAPDAGRRRARPRWSPDRTGQARLRASDRAGTASVRRDWTDAQEPRRGLP